MFNHHNKNDTQIKQRSFSFSSFHNNSPTKSITSSNSSYFHPTKCHTDPSLSSHHTTTTSKRFHSSHLGRPPGSSTTKSHKKPPMFGAAAAGQQQQMTRSSSVLRIAPMKEVEKMIADLKKENFDLKLRLYHLEDMMTKDVDMYQLKEENYRLKMSLEDRTKHAEGLEKELTLLLLDNQTSKRSTSTQTIATKNDYPITTFESSPEAFGLLPAITTSTISTTTATTKTPTVKKQNNTSSWQRIKANEDYMSSVVGALQNVKIDNNRVDSWLNQLNNNNSSNFSFSTS